MTIDGLEPDTRYFYRMVYSSDGGITWFTGNEHTFHTQRPIGAEFVFTIISDSHLGMMGSSSRYYYATLNVAADNPDFHLDLGDTFIMSGVNTQENADAVYLAQRPYFGNFSHSAPVFLALGNHEDEEGWNIDDTPSKALMSMHARKKYYLNPVSDGFYSGNDDPLPELGGADNFREDYYAWIWGDALFIVLDPFQYTMANPYGAIAGEDGDDPATGDQWNWTLGEQQFNWFKQVLEDNRDMKFKFVFAHHVTGGQLYVGGFAGNPGYVRGGGMAAPYFEWGGQNADGTWGFDTERPGWGNDPVHQLMIANGVSAFFHGHDHQFVHEICDGIVYQEVPSPSMTGYGFDLYDDSPYVVSGGNLPNSGHLRVTVAPDEATVEYVRSDASEGGMNGVVSYSYKIPAGGLNMAPSQPTLVQPADDAAGVSPDPTLEVTVTDPDNDDLTVTFHGRAVGESTEIITTSPGIPSGGNASVTWAGLADGTEYEWYVEVSDGYLITSGPVWSFTTENSAPPPPPPPTYYDLVMGVASGSGGTTQPAGTHSYQESSIVAITAIAAPRYKFAYWEGDVGNPGSPTTTVTMDGGKTVTAHFIRSSYSARVLQDRRRLEPRDGPLEEAIPQPVDELPDPVIQRRRTTDRTR